MFLSFYQINENVCNANQKKRVIVLYAKWNNEIIPVYILNAWTEISVLKKISTIFKRTYVVNAS